MSWSSKCAVVGCTNYKFKSKRSFYRFPKNKELCAQWITLSQKPGLDEVLEHRGSSFVNRNNYVCSDHFQEKDFRNKNLLSQGIWRSSLPSLLLPKPKQTGRDGERNSDVATELVNSDQKDSATNEMEHCFTIKLASTGLFVGENHYYFSSGKRERSEECELTLVEEELLDDPEESTCLATEQVCDRITVKVEKDPEDGENSGENNRPQVQEPEYIEVKCEPFEVEEEEATDVDVMREYSLGFW